jgi:hypothetical protein
LSVLFLPGVPFPIETSFVILQACVSAGLSPAPAVVGGAPRQFAKARRRQEAKEANLQIHLVKVIAKPYYADARACSDPLSAQFIQ